MYKKKLEDIQEIKSLFSEEVEVSVPDFPGMVHDIYFVQTSTNKIVFRFSDQDQALKNAHTSRILIKYGIPVPKVAAYRINRGKRYIEIYDYIEGKTLYERNKEGISPKQIKKIYKQLYEICCKLAKIPRKELMYSHDRSKMYDYLIKKKDLFFAAMNFAPLVVGHDDLHDKNILLDEHDNICAILDLDAIRIKPFVIFLIRLMDEGQKYGYTVESIKDFDEKAYNNGKLLNIPNQIKLYDRIHGIFKGRLKNKSK